MTPPTERQSRLIWLACSGLAVALIVALVVGVIWGLGRVLHLLSPVLWPLAVAGVLAYLLDPVVDFFERKGAPRTRSILLVFAIAVGIFVALVGSVLPQAIAESRDLAVRIPDYIEKIWHRTEDWVQHPPELLRRYLKVLTHDTPAALPQQQAATNAVPTGTNGPGF